MNKLFIPEIGTELTLSQKWTFPLYVERRNESLAKKLGYPNSIHWYGNEWISKEVYDLYDKLYEDYKIKEEKELGKDFFEGKHLTYTDHPEWKRLNNWYRAEHDKIHKQYENTLHIGKECMEVPLIAGTILKVDRIYIRKGKGMSDFSSLTFYIKNGPYKGARFWAKLNDVNQIKFE
ncbi:MAG: hypothetical protein PHC93_04580 [Candidatus Omnitrophica bacterium]|nr:hypothetical protein [Candidatus Omnitrophota bacterium]